MNMPNAHAYDWYLLFSGAGCVKHAWRHSYKGYITRKRVVRPLDDACAPEVPKDLDAQFDAFRAEAAKAREHLLRDFERVGFPVKIRWHQVGLYLSSPTIKGYHVYECPTDTERHVARELLFYVEDTEWSFDKRHYELVWRYVLLRQEPAHTYVARVLHNMAPQDPFRDSMARLLRVLVESEEEKVAATLEAI